MELLYKTITLNYIKLNQTKPNQTYKESNA